MPYSSATICMTRSVWHTFCDNLYADPYADLYAIQFCNNLYDDRMAYRSDNLYADLYADPYADLYAGSVETQHAPLLSSLKARSRFRRSSRSVHSQRCKIYSQ
eukprot:5195637-Prymnesium_polylepis.1